jgi:hypothetical protein
MKIKSIFDQQVGISHVECIVSNKNDILLISNLASGILNSNRRSRKHSRSNKPEWHEEKGNTEEVRRRIGR